MQNLLTVELLVAVLLVTTFTSVGLLGLWAATSRWHWFLRVVVVLGVLSILLLRPMYEPFFIFLTQVGTIAPGVALCRHGRSIWQAIRGGDRRFLPRFSLRDLLLVTPIVAVVAAIAVTARRELDWGYWPVVPGIGVTAGFLTLLAVWLADSISSRYWRGLMPLLMIAPIGIVYGIYIRQFDFGFFHLPEMATWLSVLLLVAAQGVLFLLWRRTWNRSQRDYVIHVILPTVLLILVTLFPLFVVWELLHPLPIPPSSALPADDAYAELIALGNRIDDSSPVLQEWYAEPPHENKLASAVAAQEGDYRQLHQLLSRPCQMPTLYDDMTDTDDMAARRRLARFLNAKVSAALASGDINTAYATAIDGIELAARFDNGGVAVDWSTGIACRGLAAGDMYLVSERLDQDALSDARHRLLDTAYTVDNYQAMLGRERVYSQTWAGWTGHLYETLVDVDFVLFPANGSNIRRIIETLFRSETAKNTMLAAHLACLEFAKVHSRPPNSLEELVPDYFASVPVDPFTPDESPLQYRLTEDGFLVYSVGPNGVDDGGQAPTPSAFGTYIGDRDGDFRLDVHYAPDEEALNTNTNTD